MIGYQPSNPVGRAAHARSDGTCAPGVLPDIPPTGDVVPGFAVTVLPRPCAYEGNDPYEKRMYQFEGWKAPDYEYVVRDSGACVLIVSAQLLGQIEKMSAAARRPLTHVVVADGAFELRQRLRG